MKVKQLIRILVILLVFAALITSFQDKLIFFPMAWPKDFVMPGAFKNGTITQATLKTPDGISLDAYFAKAASADPANEKVVLFSHGNGGNLAYRLGKLNRICEAGFSVFIYDYRGFGRSTGKPDVQGAIIDGKTALAYLLEEKQIKPENIILYGESLGTGIAAEILKDSDKSFAGVVLESGFASLGAQANRRFPIIGAMILKKDLPTLETIKNYKGELLIIHSKNDGVIPYSDSELLFAACQSDHKLLFTIEGAGHNDPVWDDPKYLQTWQDFKKNLQ